MLQAAKSLLKSNGVINSLKDDGLYQKATHFRHVNAEQSQLSTIDKAFRNHESSKAFNEQMADRAERLSNAIANAPKGSKKEARLRAQETHVKNNLNLSNAEFTRRRQAAIDDGGKTRSKEFAEALKQPGKDLRRGAVNYYTSGTTGQKATRIGATALAYGAAATGTRYMTGGSATTNNRGQRDIAGIPFI